MESRPRRELIRFIREERAQATLEYILIVSVLVAIAVLVVRDLIRPLLQKLTDGINDAITNKMFKSGDPMHHSPFKK